MSEIGSFQALVSLDPSSSSTSINQRDRIDLAAKDGCPVREAVGWIFQQRTCSGRGPASLIGSDFSIMLLAQWKTRSPPFTVELHANANVEGSKKKRTEGIETMHRLPDWGGNHQEHTHTTYVFHSNRSSTALEARHSCIPSPPGERGQQQSDTKERARQHRTKATSSHSTFCYMSDSLKSQMSSRTKTRRRQIVGKVLSFRHPSMIEKQRARDIETKPKRRWPREDDAPSLAVKYPNKLRRPPYPRPRLSTRSRLTTLTPKTCNLRSSYSILVLRHHQDGHSSKQASTRALRRAKLASGNSDPAACRRCSLRSDTHHQVPTPDGGLRPETSTNRSLPVVSNGQWLRSASVPLTRYVHFAEEPGCLGYSTKRPQSTKCPLFQTNRKPLAEQSEKPEASKIIRVGTGRRRQWAEGSRRGTTLPGQYFGARCDRAHSRAIGKKGRSFDGRSACLGRGMDASLIASPSHQVDIEMTKPRRERIVNDWTCPVPRAGGKAVEGWAGPVFAADCAVETWMLAW
ncbi:hypothetical protein IWX46DRAFT_583873 [Phyllosticta citricarpa]|uniref:Uncharacterized protein n=1 Tax=Phyllosticta citricarpa TaxID=55181 RepID=A0ABR1LN58_9PEZI